MREYFLTIRRHNVKLYVSEQDILNVLCELDRRMNIKFKYIVYEIDNKYNQLHSHMLARTDKPVLFKNNSSINGFRVYWLHVYDGQPLVCYLHKDSCDKYQQEEILITNYYRQHYGFLDMADGGASVQRLRKPISQCNVRRPDKKTGVLR